ncbi:hypothetical protein SODALDRAFT_19257 [Sodiomyces alkalinus F11]|uniref:Uncharacterized protein n=1 Tax=Sodiomyces alkalinus (strain CBS 110278 / VKM F-3762 / F11) TaxID=1314773 RepID=A0A3N2Q7E5_SODAK|nr:hypothetical protein SODALDRAFT_19257 [Sodiomyces alkalinus F11]ROT42607.1 hypothetical protein SODALDRAFT_19257 [Sodiomyces alkalinus F11]
MASADPLSRTTSGFSSSDNTYHSFYDIELFPPASPPKDQPRGQESVSRTQSRHDDEKKENEPPSSIEMRRQDSGYESLPRTSTSSSPSSTDKSSTARSSTASRRSATAAGPRATTTAPTTRPDQSTPHSRSRAASCRGRPVTRRSPKPTPAYYYYNNNNNSYSVRTQNQSSYIHFPAHPTDLALANSKPYPRLDLEPEPPNGSSTTSSSSPAVHRPPPQPTTHYWTSDRTRRLEYAAIDAAHRGVKGWCRRHLVPDCFLPKDKARVAFDDDSGSVRRYRLDLSDDDDDGGYFRDGAVSPVSLRPVNRGGREYEATDGEQREKREAKRPKLSLWGRMRTW